MISLLCLIFPYLIANHPDKTFHLPFINPEIYEFKGYSAEIGLSFEYFWLQLFSALHYILLKTKLRNQKRKKKEEEEI